MRIVCLLFSTVLAFASVAVQLRGEEAFRLKRVGYVMLGVADIQRSLAFYHGKLGLPVTSQANDLAFFDGETISVVVSTEIGKEPGAGELVFAVESVEQAYQALVSVGIQFQAKPHALNEKSWAASTRDPDGHIVSIFGPK